MAAQGLRWEASEADGEVFHGPLVMAVVGQMEGIESHSQILANRDLDCDSW